MISALGIERLECFYKPSDKGQKEQKPFEEQGFLFDEWKNWENESQSFRKGADQFLWKINGEWVPVKDLDTFNLLVKETEFPFYSNGTQPIAKLRLSTPEGLPQAKVRFLGNFFVEWMMLLAAEGIRTNIQEIAEVSPIGVIVVEAGKIAYFNKKTEQILGLAMEKARGNRIGDFYVFENQLKEASAHLQKDGQFRGAIFVTNGKGYPVPIRLSAIRLSGGIDVGYFEDRRDHAETLSQIQKSMMEAGSLREGLESLVSSLQDLLLPAFCVVTTMDWEGQRFTVEAGTSRCGFGQPDFSWNLIRGRKFPFQHWGPMVKQLNSGKPIFLKLPGSGEYLAEIKRILRITPDLNSLLIVPLMSGEKAVGFLALGEIHETLFDVSDKKNILFLCNLAELTGEWVSRHQLAANVLRARESLQAAFEASNAILSNKAPREVMAAIVQQLKKAADAKVVALYLLDSERRILDGVLEGGENWFYSKKKVPGKSITWRVFKTGRTEAIGDMENAPSKPDPGILAQGIKSAVVLPLMVGGKAHGVVWILYGISHARQFVDAEIKAFSLFINQAAIAYENSLRLTAQADLRAALERLTAEMEFPKFCKRLLDESTGLFQAKSGCLWVRERGSDLFELNNTKGVNKKLMPELRVSLAASPLFKATLDEPSVHSPSQLLSDTKFVQYNLSEALNADHIRIVALSLDKNLLGFLFLGFDSPDSFWAQERELVANFAQHAAVSLAKTRLLEDLRSARATTKAVAQSSMTEEITDTLDLIAKSARDLLGCDSASIYIYRDEIKHITHVSAAPKSALPARKAFVGKVVPGSFYDQVLKREERYWSNLGAADELFQISPIARSEGIEAAAIYPLRAKGIPIGIFFVNYCRPHDFLPEEFAYIELFANQAAVAISAALVNDQKNRLTSALSTFHDIVGEDFVSLDLGETYDQIATRALKATNLDDRPASRVSFWIVRNGSYKRIAMVPQKGPMAQTEGKPPIGIVGTCFSKGKVLDTKQDPEVRPSRGNQVEIAVPLIIDDKVFGVIHAEYQKEENYDPRETTILAAFAHYAGTAIQSAQRYENLNQLKGYVGGKTAVEWIKMVSLTWGHGIRRSVGTAQLYLTMLREGLGKGEDPSKLAKHMDNMESVLDHISETPILAPLSAEDAVDDVAVNELLGTYLRRLWQHERVKPVALQTDFQPEVDREKRVRVGRNWLRQVFEIITENAVRHLKGATEIESKVLKVATRLDGAKVQIEFTDNGRGIPDHILKKLTHEPIDRDEGAVGAGIGLVLARTIVEASNGTLSVNKPATGGACFQVSLPVQPFHAVEMADLP